MIKIKKNNVYYYHGELNGDRILSWVIRIKWKTKYGKIERLLELGNLTSINNDNDEEIENQLIKKTISKLKGYKVGRYTIHSYRFI